jgi:hypothetical protein
MFGGFRKLTRMFKDIVNPKDMANYFKMHGHYHVDHYRMGNYLTSYDIDNDIVNVGKNMIFNVMFNSGTQSATGAWNIGIINNAGFTALAATDTMASHTGWAEFTGYSGGTRVLWGQGSSSGQTITNASPATFNITSTATLYGIFVCDSSTSGGTTGNLWSTAPFASTVPVTNGDALKVTYSLSA